LLSHSHSAPLSLHSFPTRRSSDLAPGFRSFRLCFSVPGVATSVISATRLCRQIHQGAHDDGRRRQRKYKFHTAVPLLPRRLGPRATAWPLGPPVPGARVTKDVTSMRRFRYHFLAEFPLSKGSLEL